MKIIIIGGGIVGISAAHYLVSSGHEVVVVDRSSMGDGCSFGNAGMVVPSHIIPLASPGMIARGIRWMLRPDSPFYIRLRFSRELLTWGWQFYRHSNRKNVQRAAPALKELSLFSQSLYRQLAADLPFDFGYTESGLLMLYRTAEAEHEEADTARFARSLGIEVHSLTAAQVQRMEHHVEVRVRGGTYYPGDAHLIPQQLMRNWIPHLANKGVLFLTEQEVTDFRIKNRCIVAVRTTRNELTADEVVLAAGAWSAALARKLSLRMPLQAGRGYGFFTPHATLPVTIPAILLEERVALTPMGQSVRLGGTMEITSPDAPINMKRVRAIARAVPLYYPQNQVTEPLPDQVWSGLRPCSPDGLPYIGRIHRYENLIAATGHAMMGLSLGPGTGKLIAQIINREKPAVPLAVFKPDRF